ncbi:SF3a splicing factor complex subunit [Elasticomyces elasticus]|nr:SF3a splicing factor complex subunit [Elasticomyces elasticus]
MAVDTTSVLDALTPPEGVILPPKNVRDVVEKTAGYVARNGAQFEDKMKTQHNKDSKLAFLYPEDAYGPYYQWRLTEIRAGRGNQISAGRENEVVQKGGETGVSGKGKVRVEPDKPEDWRFSARMPNISATDLEIVKLTALFAAKNGRNWITALSQREAGNYQFDFLRPQHSLYNFFSRLIDQYTELLLPPSHPSTTARTTELEANVANRFRVLERARKRAEWVKFQEVQKEREVEETEMEKVAYAQIDWHDFVVVETVVFDERDEGAELPAPTTKNDLMSASLEQKAAMSIAPSRRIEEAMPTFDDYNQFYGAQQPQQPQQQMPPPPQQPQYQPTPPQPQPTWQPPPGADDDLGRMAEVRADRERARAAQEAARTAPNAANVRVRDGYVPRTQARKGALPANHSICPNCQQPIHNDEIAQHMKIEMLDPQWREQSKINQHRSSTTNLSTQSVAENLKRLASQRSDVFDPVTGQSVDEAELARRAAVQQGQNGVGEGQGPPTWDVQEQIRGLHQRYKG